MKKICFLCIMLIALCTISTNADVVEKNMVDKVTSRAVTTDTIYNIMLYGVMEAVDPYKDGFIDIFGEEGVFTMSMEKNGEYNEVTIYKLRVSSYEQTYFKEEGGFYNWTGELILNAIDPNDDNIVGQLKGIYGCQQGDCSYNGVFTDSKGIKSSFRFQHESTAEMSEEP